MLSCIWSPTFDQQTGIPATVEHCCYDNYAFGHVIKCLLGEEINKRCGCGMSKGRNSSNGRDELHGMEVRIRARLGWGQSMPQDQVHVQDIIVSCAHLK
ncbi:hypothetical protein RRG08_033185 [Elysia crispata]|uniref:Uncharacterized protein n=1 Tax=Elysia crispata TaxID=231223 RepID=A0AAE1BBM0_9GAST|nr:hypothetical protein RRG08_033185 [Elysia crispata]